MEVKQDLLRVIVYSHNRYQIMLGIGLTVIWLQSVRQVAHEVVKVFVAYEQIYMMANKFLTLFSHCVLY